MTVDRAANSENKKFTRNNTSCKNKRWICVSRSTFLLADAPYTSFQLSHVLFHLISWVHPRSWHWQTFFSNTLDNGSQNLKQWAQSLCLVYSTSVISYTSRILVLICFSEGIISTLHLIPIRFTGIRQHNVKFKHASLSQRLAHWMWLCCDLAKNGSIYYEKCVLMTISLN